MTSTAPPVRPARWGLAAAAGLGIAVSAVLGAYSLVHPGTGAAVSTFGFSSLYALKSWLTTAAMVFVLVQVLSALAMWGKLPGVTGSPAWAGPLHRWSGVAAFLLTLPVVFLCIWALGFADYSARTVIHSVTGLLFYGVFATKMLSLRLHGIPGWALPVLGGLLAVLLTIVWFTSALWFFTQPGLALW